MKRPVILCFLALSLSLMLSSYLYSVNATVFYNLYLDNPNPEMGLISPIEGDYTKQNATSMTLTAYPFDGYAFIAWNISVPEHQWILNFNNPMTISPEFAGDDQLIMNITVLWGFANVSLTVVNVAHGTTNVTGVSYHPSMERIAIKSTPSSGYSLSGWIIDSLHVPNYSEDNVLIVSMEQSHTVTPVYTQDPVPVTMFTSVLPYITPLIVIGSIGGTFSIIGSRFDHGVAGFMMGGGIALTILSVSGLIPMWILTLSIMLACIGVYFWFKGG